jgi:hypothetical protein
MMKRTMMIVLAAAVALSMTACSALDAILQVNVLKGLAALKADDIAEADADTLLEMSNSTSFYVALAGNPAVKADVLVTINAEIGGSIDSAKDQELAVLAADILLRTTAAGELVNNVAAIASDLMQDGAIADFQALIDTIAPASLYAADGSVDQVAFSAMIDALLAADAYYQALGNAIGAGGDYAAGTDVSKGDVAQSALIAAVIFEVSESLPGTYTDTGEYLYDLLTGATALEPTTFTMPIMNSGYLGNLLAAAGLSF